MAERLQHRMNQSEILKESQLQSMIETESDLYSEYQPQRQTFGQKICVQLTNIGLLIRKNISLTVKNPKNILFLIIAPFVLSGLLFLFQKLADDTITKEWIDNPQTKVDMLPRCIGDNCTSIMWMTVVSNTTQDRLPEWITHTMEYIRKKTNLGDTIRKWGYVSTDQDWKRYRQQLTDNPNKTQIGIVFCIDSSQVIPQFFCYSDNETKSYYLILNKTDSFGTIFSAPQMPIPTDTHALQLKVLIDNAILDFEMQKDFADPRIQYKTQQYPVVPNRFLTNFDIVTQAGAFYYMITPLFAFLFIQNEIVREKEFKLRQGLNVFGASHFGYWVSWFVISIVYSLVVSLSTIAAGQAYRFAFFTDTPFLIVLIMMFSFCLAMQMLSYLIATLVPNLKAANSISYGFILFAIVVEAFLADVNLLALIFQTNPGSFLVFMKLFLSLYPPFSYSKSFAMITLQSGYHYNMHQNKWQKGQGFSWGNFTSPYKGLTITKGDFVEYSTLNSVLVLCLDVAIYGVLTWYFDHIIESNRGRGESPIFFLQKSYWVKSLKSKRKHLPSIDDIRNPTYNIRDEQISVTNERVKVNLNQKNNKPVGGMRIKGLSKTFKDMCSKNTVEALRNITFEIDNNELMAVLGHNGAGKTTLINILTGVSSPDPSTDLQIIINNHNINNINEVRKHIGVCPQFDILWKEMTAQQHLRLFARLKGITTDQVEQRIDDILKFVSLSTEKKSKVGSFSGGMKRRLSLAIAAVGNPKIIFLDEPTTGLDPKVRQQVWTLIEKLKKHKSIILTTHSMQQADILSDQISILVKGRLKCIGSSIYLKDSYGSGYRIAMNVQDGRGSEVMRYIGKLIPDAVEIDSNGGNLLVGINTYENLIKLVKMLESEESSGLDEYSLKQHIKDWNVSHTTLEQVFMKVTKEGEQINEQ